MTFTVLIFSIVLIDLSVGGLLKHLMISPFGNIVASDEKQYHSDLSSEAIETSVSNIFKNFDEFNDATSEPFCMIGGQYMAKVINDPTPGADLQKWTLKTYYCKTTQDLLERVNIPSSWQDDDLIIYCNDGAMVNNEEINFDFITSQINTYKSCVVRNMDAEGNVSILYGFDVGNKVVDHYSEYYFNNDTKEGPVLVDLEFEELVDEEIKTGMIFISTVAVPYKSSGASGYEPMTTQEAKDYVLSENPDLTSSIELEHLRNVEDGSDSVSIYKLYDEIEYKVSTYLYNNSNGENFYFTYNSLNNMYTLSRNNEELETPIEDVFDLSIMPKLSRVALFKKMQNKYVYGYEEVSNSVVDEFPYNDSIKPIYMVELKNFNGYSKQNCIDSLKKFDSKDGFDANTGVSCSGNKISIVPLNLNSKYDDNKYSFHLFKNIAISLE